MERHIILNEKIEDNLENNGMKIDDLEILQTLGKGSYGFVAKVKSKKDQKIYAMKMIDFGLIKDPKEMELSLNEMKIIQSLNSPHIIKYYNSFNEQNKFYILMEYINNGDIKGYIQAHQSMNKPISEGELWELFYQCMSGLCYIHQNKLIHRDIKPANLFLTDDKTIKIGDFGVSAIRNLKNFNQNAQYQEIFGDTKNLTKETLMVGTPLYMSPEMFNQEEYGSKVDVYALGCTFYEMCYFTPPRIPMPMMNVKGEIITMLNDLQPKANKDFYSQDVKDLIDKMIERDKTKRISSSNAFEIIKDKYNNLFQQNTSINCVYKCLFTCEQLILSLNKHNSNLGQNKPISTSFLNSFNNINNDWNKNIRILRDILTYNNSNFIDPGEIEPEELVEFILKNIHIENNKVPNRFSQIYTKFNDPWIFDRQKIITKYLYNFNNYLKSFISDKFFGTLEIIKKCTKCNKERYYLESFYYLKFDANEVMKYCFNSENFILDCIKKEENEKVINENFCPNCNVKTDHLENKKIILINYYLIISLKYEGDKCNTQNLKCPILFEFKNGEALEKYNLKGVIKKSIKDGKKSFECLYKNINQPKFILEKDGQQQVIETPSFNDKNNIVMLFYSK